MPGRQTRSQKVKRVPIAERGEVSAVILACPYMFLNVFLLVASTILPHRGEGGEKKVALFMNIFYTFN